MDDASLVQAYLNGDSQAFEELYGRYVRQLYTFVYHKTHHRETAEDIVSDVFMKALEKISTFNPKKGAFGAWLYRIARNAVIDHYRRLRPTKDMEDAWDLSDEQVNIPRDTDVRLQIQTLQPHLASLKPTQRDIILLRIWQEMPFKDIAEKLGMTEAACKMSYKRSIDSLKTILPVILLLLVSLFHELRA